MEGRAGYDCRRDERETMTCLSALQAIADNAGWFIFAAVCAPFASAGAVAAWYELRHGKGINMTRYFDRTLFVGPGMHPKNRRSAGYDF